MREIWVWPLGQADPLEKEMATYSSIFLPRKSHRQRSLAGYSPRGPKRVRPDLGTKHHKWICTKWVSHSNCAAFLSLPVLCLSSSSTLRERERLWVYKASWCLAAGSSPEARLSWQDSNTEFSSLEETDGTHLMMGKPRPWPHAELTLLSSR